MASPIVQLAVQIGSQAHLQSFCQGSADGQSRFDLAERVVAYGEAFQDYRFGVLLGLSQEMIGERSLYRLHPYFSYRRLGPVPGEIIRHLDEA